MNAKKILNNIPWKRFNSVYGNASVLKENFQKILDGNADLKTYKFIIDNVEHQDTLWKISPWTLKLFIALLEEEKTDKKQLLEYISVIYSAANFQVQAQGLDYKPTKGMLEKYSKIKNQLFDDENTEEFWMVYKSMHRYFINVVALEYISHYKKNIESFAKSTKPNTLKVAKRLIEDINNPKQYFQNEEKAPNQLEFHATKITMVINDFGLENSIRFDFNEGYFKILRQDEFPMLSFEFNNKIAQTHIRVPLKTTHKFG